MYNRMGKPFPSHFSYRYEKLEYFADVLIIHLLHLRIEDLPTTELKEGRARKEKDENEEHIRPEDFLHRSLFLPSIFNRYLDFLLQYTSSEV